MRKVTELFGTRELSFSKETFVFGQWDSIDRTQPRCGLFFDQGNDRIVIFKEDDVLLFATQNDIWPLDELRFESERKSNKQSIVHAQTGKFIRPVISISSDQSDPIADPNVPSLFEWLEDVLNGRESKAWYLSNWSNY